MPEVHVQEETKIIDKSTINLPGSSIQTSDYIIIGNQEHLIDRDTIEDILITKSISEGSITKINYAFKNLGQSRQISFSWKNKIDSKYDRINEFPLSESFTTRNPELKLYSHDIFTYFLTFKDMELAFGAVTITYDPDTRTLTAVSDKRPLSSGKELIMDPGGGSVPAITINHPANNSVVSENKSVSLNFTVVDDQSPIYLMQIFASNESSPSTADLVYWNSSGTNNTETIYNWSSPVTDSDDPDLMLLFHFDNNTAFGENESNVYDFSGNGNNGTIPSSGPTVAGAKLGRARFFGNLLDIITNPYINVSDSLTLRFNTSFSITAWVYDESTSGARIIAKKGQTDVNYNCRLNNDKLSFVVENSSGTSTTTAASNIPGEVWVHIACIYNGTHILLYENGVQTGTPVKVDSTILTSSEILTIGNTIVGGSAWQGSIDELAIWNRTLSSSEIMDLYRLRNDTYYWYVKADDGTLSSTSSTRQFYIGEPFLQSQELYPSSPIDTDNLELNATCVDAEQPTLTAYYIVYRNSTINQSESAISVSNNTQTILRTITHGNTTPAEQWYAEVWCYDGKYNTTHWNTSIRTIQTPPQAQNVLLNSTDYLNRTTGNLNGSFTYFDADSNSQARNETKWYLNGVENTSFTNLTNITSGNLSAGQTWIFSVRVNDGTEWSSWVNSTSLNISSLLFTPTDSTAKTHNILGSAGGNMTTNSSVSTVNQTLNFTHPTWGKRLELKAHFSNDNVNLGPLTIRASVYKTAVNLAGTSGIDSGNHTLFLPNNFNSGFFVCPNATSLAQVNVSCPGRVLFSHSEASAKNNKAGNHC